jgi:hypothetical protein
MTDQTSRNAGRRVAVLLTLLGAGLILLAGTRIWATVTTTGGLPGTSHLTVGGRRAAPAVIPIALAAAAGAIVLATSARLVRALVGGGLLIAGVTVAATSVHAAGDRNGTVGKAMVDALGLYRSGSGSSSGALVAFSDQHVRFSAWPWVALAGGVLIVLAGLLTLL